MKLGQFSSVIIFSFFEGKNRWIGLLLMMFIPYVSSIMNKIYLKILSLWYKDLVSIFLKQRENKDGMRLSNFSYTAMCWYCINNHSEKQKSLLCEGDSLKTNEKINNKSKRIPDYLPNNNFILNHQGEEIKIFFSGKSIVVKSIKMKFLTEFVSHVNNVYENYCYSNLDPDKMYVCKWKQPKRYSDSASFVGEIMTIKKTYDNVYLPSKLINGIKKDILEFKNNEKFYEENGIPYKRGYLLYGPPGTGKTSTVYAIARENNMNMYKLNLLETLKKNKSGNYDTIKDIVQKIPSGSVVLIEEVDTQIYNDRKNTNDNKDDNKEEDKDTVKIKITDKDKIPMSQLMDILDGYDSLHGCIIILTTNHKEYLDPALIRPGRVDMHYFFGLLTEPDIKSTIKRFTGFDINVPKMEMTSSKLINQILLPNRKDKSEIIKLVNQ